MSKKNETAGETAKSNVKSFTMNDITYTDGEDRVTIEITGQAFQNLKEMAEIFGRWNGGRESPSEMLRDFCFHTTFLNLYNKKNNDESDQTLAGAIIAQFCNNEYVCELEQAFEKAGFDMSY